MGRGAPRVEGAPLGLGLEIARRMDLNPMLNASRIVVRVDRDLVELSGEVPTFEMARLAEALARDAPGVKGVRNRLAVLGDTHGGGQPPP